MNTTATMETERTAGTPARRTQAEAAPRRGVVLAGRFISGFLGIFLLFDGGARVAHFAPYVEGLVKAGYPAQAGTPIGVALIVCTLLYLLPRTAVLGAILVTGYLGGAMATHVRVGESNYIFAFVFAALIWLGLWLREPRLRALVPLRRDA